MWRHNEIALAFFVCCLVIVSSFVFHTSLCFFFFVWLLAEYDPDRHCGVQLEGDKKPCKKSLTCKVSWVFANFVLVAIVNTRNMCEWESVVMHTKEKTCHLMD